ncbi:MAG: hypothetical protein FWF52_08370 [Candidatus Azobacteroides sp.]|nr:hypothetical protein [Candidatus Azobacteroides sp.]
MNDLFANLYELITGQTDLANELYNSEAVYVPVGWCMVLLSLIGMIVYYYLINHPRFNRWYHWLLMVLVVCLINFGIAYFRANDAIDSMYAEQNQDSPFSAMEFISFSMANALWTFVFSFAFSIGIKWKSRNASRTPF